MKQQDRAINSGKPIEEYSLEKLEWLVTKANKIRDIWIATLVECSMEMGKAEQQNEHLE